ncbi:MAG: FAD-binding oxidoreductase [Kiritimatiellae bacterium]|nr:FAD-binding oxidoreductase [Kiritimatiellia bacterium]MDW8458939.1 FAD-binding oxidoreductase [Verrucomicrobiota bacterium]
MDPRDEIRSVVSVRNIGPDIFVIELERRGLEFTPGDCMALYAGDGRVSRPYSIASGTQEPVLRFIIRRMPGGDVSPFLCARQPGDVVRASAPFGWFRPGAHAAIRPFVFMATGTGIAPFLAYLRSPGARRPAAFRYGCRLGVDLVDADWLRDTWGAECFVSREDINGCRRGRITECMEELPVGNLDYYLCGLDAMIDEVGRFLQERGVPLTQIHRECFFNAQFSAER